MTLYPEVVVSAVIRGSAARCRCRAGHAPARPPPHRLAPISRCGCWNNGSWPVDEPWPVLPSLMWIAVGIVRRWSGFWRAARR